jgi:hypothetical protein
MPPASPVNVHMTTVIPAKKLFELGIQLSGEHLLRMCKALEKLSPTHPHVLVLCNKLPPNVTTSSSKRLLLPTVSGNPESQVAWLGIWLSISCEVLVKLLAGAVSCEGLGEAGGAASQQFPHGCGQRPQPLTWQEHGDCLLKAISTLMGEQRKSCDSYDLLSEMMSFPSYSITNE